MTLLACSCLNAQPKQPLQPPSLPNGNWQQNAARWISQKQAAIRALQGNEFAAVNAANSLCFAISPGGYKVRTLQAKNDQWLAHFTLRAVNKKPWRASAPQVIKNESKLLYRYKDISIEYSNEETGFRQNFIVERKQDRLDQLTLSLHVNSAALTPTLQNSRLAFRDKKGMARLFYDSLVVWDADHKTLPAHFELSGNDLHIVVDDRSATYPVTIDPLNHTPAWTDSGDGLVFSLLNDLSLPLLYGFSVSDAGDVNGDGYSDIVVGAPTYVDILNISAGTFNAVSVGAAFVYYGSASGLSATPNEVLQPTTQAGALFGYSVSKAGDVNGDGYGDLVIGAPADRITLNVGAFPVATSVATGKVYVYYGGPAGTFDGNVSTEPTVSATLSLQQSDFGTLLSVPANPLYGFSVSNAGDVNGDGRGDIVVGSPGYVRLLPVPLLGGRVDVFHGTAGGVSTTPARTITGGILNALFGFSVSSAGNVNGDAIAGKPVSDIVVGAPGDLTQAGAGQAYVFHGSAGGITATSVTGANATLNSGLLSTLFGYSVSNAGDVNGDGYGDVVIGEPAALESLLTQTASVGGAKIFYGSSGGVALTGATTLNSPRRPSLLGILQGNLLFGYSVSYAGDLNCDGLSDVVIGEPGGTSLSLGSGLLNLVSANVLSGQAYVYYGRSGGPVNLPGYTFGETASVSVANLIGYSVSEGGDFNGDGKADLLIGAPNGTLSLAGGLLPAVGNLLNIVTTSSVGSAYGFGGCLQQTVLPLQVTDFSASKENENVVLHWRNKSEEGTEKYVVQRSNDQRSFRPIGSVYANGGGMTPYSLKDSTPQAVNFYRIQILGKDGTARYSETVRLQFDAKKESISIVPNPVRDHYTVRFSGLVTGSYTASVFDATGRLQDQKSFAVYSGDYRLPMDRGGLTGGMYFIRVTNSAGKVIGESSLICE